MTLWFANAALVLLALLFLLKPLLAKPSSRVVHGRGSERELLADRLAELEREHRAGLIAKGEYEQAERETKAAYAACADAPAREDLRTPVVAAVVVTASLFGAAVFYFYSADGYRALLAGQEAAEMGESFEATTAALERRLAEHPRDAEARRLLAVSKYLIGDYAAAAAEYGRADELGAITDADDWIRYADALLRSGNAARGTPGERALAALDEMLVLEPQSQRALFFSGLLNLERGAPARAIERWERLLELMPPDDSAAEELRRMIAHARNPNLETETQEAEGGDADVDVDTDADAIGVSVSLSAALRDVASPGDAVFVYARAVNGPPMPLAVERLRVSQLPAQVRLGKENAMMEGTSLGAFDQLEIVARVSKQGGARTQPGDLIGVVSSVSPGQAVSVEISKIVYFYSADGYRALLAGQEAAEMGESFEATTAALERRLAEHPRDAEARRLLAVSKYLIGDYAAAAAEYGRADELGAITDADDWIRYADALLRSGNAARGTPGERALAALDEMLVLEPQSQRALFFSGLLNLERGAPARAIERWERLLELMPPDDSAAEELRRMIAHARNPNLETETQEAEGGDADVDVDTDADAIGVSVSLSAALRDVASPGDAVFVYARAVNGPPMPLAVERLRVSQLPAQVRLGKENAMMEGTSLGAFDQLEIVARVSKQGGARTQPGDLIGVVSPVSPGQVVSVEISKIVE